MYGIVKTKLGTVELKTKEIKGYSIDFRYPLLSDFIKSLNMILNKFGDGYVMRDNEFTDEVTDILVEKRKRVNLDDDNVISDDLFYII